MKRKNLVLFAFSGFLLISCGGESEPEANNNLKEELESNQEEAKEPEAEVKEEASAEEPKEKDQVETEKAPEEQKEVIMLRHYGGLSFKEIAEQTNVSINTALGRMRYALINLRKIIESKNIILTKE